MKKKVILTLILFVILLLIYTAGCKPLLNRILAPEVEEGIDLEVEDEANTEKENSARLEVSESEDSQKEISESKIGTLLEELDNSISSLVERVLPSVVNIAVRTDDSSDSGGIGSGVLFTEDGYIITNNHVAGNAIEMLVTLSDGSNYPAELVGTSEITDIAVIKIDAENLSPAIFASIEDQKVGEIVIAIGSPFGIQQTITLGIISGKGRNIPVTSDALPIVDLIQTDTAINPGNSGGPLINTSGEVIGINTLVLSLTGTSSGIGFAVPTDTAANIANQIIKYGKAVIPFIGVEMGTNTSKIPGAYIINTVEESPALKSGIENGDILVEFGGKDIKNAYDLLAQILRSNCNDVVGVKVYRNGEYIDLSIELLECPIDLYSSISDESIGQKSS